MTTDSGAITYQTIDDLHVSLDGPVLRVTLNRPDSLNSLTAPLLTALGDVLEQAAADRRVRVVRLGGAGRGFCAGAGISAEEQSDPTAHGTPEQVLNAANRVVRTIVGLPKPVVAAVQGPTAGVGVSLALACDVVVCSEQAFFMLAFTKIGLMPDGGASALVAASVGRARAMRLALLAERLPATEAFQAGLVSSVHPAEEFEAAVEKVVGALAHGPAVALAKTKQAINAATLTELEPAIRRESEGQLVLLHSPDVAEGITAFQEKRAPRFTDVC